LKIGEHAYLLKSPEDIKHVLVSNPQNYDKSRRLTSKRGKRLLSDGLVTTSSGDSHLRQRRMIQPPFHQKSITTFADTMITTTQEMLTRWKEGAVLNISAEMVSLTQRVVLRALFGADIEDRIEELAAAVSTKRQYTVRAFYSPLPVSEYLPTRANLRYRKATAQIDQFLYALIKKRRSATSPSHDLLSMLMGAHYKDGTFMNDKEVHDEALTICLAGYETIGVALSWTWYLVAQHVEVELKLLAELREVLNGRLPTIEDVPRLKYAEMILDESMRIYPPRWILVRRAIQDDTLPSGVSIPSGSKVWLCPYVMHHNPNYFPDPGRFDPRRFTDEMKLRRHRFAYFPFGSGPRVCIAEAFAKMEGVMVLACVAQQFELTLLSSQLVVAEARMTLRPKHGILMRVVRRGLESQAR
jgi:cytochrome P450